MAGTEPGAQIERELKTKRQELSRQKEEMGQALLDEPRWGRTGHGIKITQEGAVSHLRILEQEIAKLQERRAELPKRVPLAEAETRKMLRLEQRSIIDRIKMATYNTEGWVLELLVQHYPNPYDMRVLLRSFAESAGEIRTTSNQVIITIDAPDVPVHRRALRGLCADLNQVGVNYPGSDLPLRYGVSVHHSEAVA